MNQITTLYHHSSHENRDSILQNGLLKRCDETTSFDSEFPAEKYGSIYLIDRPEFQRMSDTWQVDVRGLDLDSDVMWPGEGESYVCTNDIGPERLTLLHNSPAVYQRLTN